jgi:hypothetical protein
MVNECFAFYSCFTDLFLCFLVAMMMITVIRMSQVAILITTPARGLITATPLRVPVPVAVNVTTDKHE